MTATKATLFECGCCRRSAGRTNAYFKAEDSQFTVPATERRGAQSGWNLSYCKSCGVLSVDPLPSEQELSRIYEGNFYSNKIYHGGIGDWMMQKPLRTANQRMSAWKQWKQRRMDGRDLDRVRAMARPLGTTRHVIRFLDIGCGTGETLYAAAKLGWDASGIELSPTAAAEARERSGRPVFNGRFETFTGDGGKYDIIHAGDVLEHLIEPYRLIEWAASMLVPGGVMHVQVPNDLAGYRMQWFSRIWWMFPPIHLHYFTPNTLSALLEQHGFSIVARGSNGESVGIDTRRSALFSAGMLAKVDSVAMAGGVGGRALELFRVLWDRLLTLPLQLIVGRSFRGFVFWMSAQRAGE